MYSGDEPVVGSVPDDKRKTARSWQLGAVFRKVRFDQKRRSWQGEAFPVGGISALARSLSGRWRVRTKMQSCGKRSPLGTVFYQKYESVGPFSDRFEEANQHMDLLFRHLSGNYRIALVGQMIRPKNRSQCTGSRTRIAAELHNFRNSDLYVSVAPYRGIREHGHKPTAAVILFCDLDDLNTQSWADGLSDEERAGYVIQILNSRGLPLPTLVVATGRGLHLIWRLTAPLPRKFFPLWSDVQRALYEALQDIGADSGCLDITRTLRLAGTVNSKPDAHGTCRVLGCSEQETDFFALVRRFNLNEIPEGMRDDAFARLPPEVEIDAEEEEYLAGCSGRCRSGRPAFTADNLGRWHSAVLRDLVAITAHRRNGGGCRGCRDQLLFITLNVEAQLGMLTSENLMARAAELADDIDPEWDRVPAEMGTLKSRLENGKGPYKFRCSTICERLGVTPDEARLARLEVLIPSGRCSLPTSAAVRRMENQQLAEQLAAAGASRSEIARRLEVSEATICRYLKPSGHASDRGGIGRTRARAIEATVQYDALGLSVPEIADKLGVSVSTVYRYRRIGRLRENPSVSISRPSLYKGGSNELNHKVEMSSAPCSGKPSVDNGDKSDAPNTEAAQSSSCSSCSSLSAVEQPSKRRKRHVWPESELEDLRRIPLQRLKNLLDLDISQDTAFRPVRNSRTVCIRVRMHDGSYHDIIVTGQKWFDKLDEAGGGGAIDFTMHVLGCQPRDAVQCLRKSLQEERALAEKLKEQRAMLADSSRHPARASVFSETPLRSFQ